MPQLGAAGPEGRIVPANNRYRAGEASIRSSEEQGRSRHHSAHRGGLELSTGTGLYGACRSTQCCLAVWSRDGWSVESSSAQVALERSKRPQRRPTTKVNHREHISRGPTPSACVRTAFTLCKTSASGGSARRCREGAMMS
jgi:hypothetical protein